MTSRTPVIRADLAPVGRVENAIEGKDGAAPAVIDGDQCNREFDQYDRERPDIKKAELDADRGYDTSISTIAALGIGLSLTVFKDFIRGPDTAWFVALVLSWVGFGLALLASLWHRKLTYDTHKRWRETLDEEFRNWSPGAWDRACARYPQIRGISIVERLKPFAFYALATGLVCLTAFLVANIQKEDGNATDNANAASQAELAHPAGAVPSGAPSERPDTATTAAPSETKVIPQTNSTVDFNKGQPQ